ncbi:MAG: preprotein translocase subunit SecG [bacterium]|nr:MAG: preprotein translocase subunit SecG [bacterium]
MLYSILLILFVLVALLMTLTILMQSAKGGGLAASFGGMGAGGVFGPRGAANFLQKATTFLAILYGLLCLTIGFIGRPTSGEGGSVIQRELQRQQQSSELPQPVTGQPLEEGMELPVQPQPESEQQPPAEEPE